MNNDINSAWTAVASILRKFGFYDIKDIVGLAGFDMQILKGLGLDNNNWNKPSSSLLLGKIKPILMPRFGVTKLA